MNRFIRFRLLCKVVDLRVRSRLVRIILYLFTLAYVTNPVAAYAAEPTVQDTFTNNNKPSPTTTAASSIASPGWSALINTIIALAILIAIIYFLLKLVNRKMSQSRSSAGIQIVAQQALTTNRSVHLIEIGGHVYVLGVGESVSILDKIEDPVTIQQIKDLTQIDEPKTRIELKGVQKILDLFSQRNKQKLETDEGFRETLEKQLRSMRQMKEAIESSSSRQSDGNDPS